MSKKSQRKKRRRRERKQCKACSGSGWGLGAGGKCPECGGTGRVEEAA